MLSKQICKEPRDYYTMAQVQAITHWSRQYLAKQAAEKKIDGAYQPGGKGGDWRFEKKGFDNYWRRKSRTVT
jgi:hypothetical protein